MPQSVEEIHQLHRTRTDAPDLGFLEWPASSWVAVGERVGSPAMRRDRSDTGS